MKLKRLYLVNILTVLVIAVFFSCASIPTPVPGQEYAKVQNIYAEYINIGDTYFKLEDYSNASEYYQKAMYSKKIYWTAFYKLAKCYSYLSKWDDALPMYKTMLKRDPKNASIKASIAYIYSMQGNYKNAKESYKLLVEEQPENLQFLENYIAVILADEKNFKNDEELYISLMEILKTDFADSKNIEKFEESYKKLKGEVKTENQAPVS